MSDARLRELERRWKETKSPDDEAAYLLERVRVGDLTRERLELAAYCGQASARIVLPDSKASGYLVEWILECGYRYTKGGSPVRTSLWPEVFFRVSRELLRAAARADSRAALLQDLIPQVAPGAAPQLLARATNDARHWQYPDLRHSLRLFAGMWTPVGVTGAPNEMAAEFGDSIHDAIRADERQLLKAVRVGVAGWALSS